MSDLNRVTLVGRLTRDPEVRHTSAGMPIVNLGLAVNGRQKDASGQWAEKPNFFDIKLFGERFERLAQHLEKGRRVGVEGRNRSQRTAIPRRPWRRRRRELSSTQLCCKRTKRRHARHVRLRTGRCE